MGLRQFGGILRADRQTNTNRPVKFRQLNQLTGVLGCIQSFQRIPLGSTMSSSRVTSYRQRSAKTTGALQNQALPRFLSRLKSQVSSRHFYEDLRSLVLTQIKGGEPLFIPALNFLFLLGLLEYRPQEDTFEYTGAN